MTDLAVFLAVLLLRLGIPLLIFRFPLPAILAALVLDAADQTIFQALTDLDLTSYQSYDKALDVFYLAIAYIATFRNWRNGTAVLVAVALWYYRLVGVTLFELTEWRPLLLIFPNTFEYYFIAIAVVRLCWDDRSLSGRTVLAIAAGIWIFIKLPQEWWIHIAQLDVTDFVKEQLLGTDATASWATALSNRPLVVVAMLAAGGALLVVCRMLWARTPPPDHAFTFDADRVATFDDRLAHGSGEIPPWTEGLAEKVVLISLTLIIFGRAIPASNASIGETFLGVGVLVASNALVTQWLRSRGRTWTSAARSFVGNLAVNVSLFIALAIVLPSSDEESSALALGFFLFLLTLIVALFDRYRPTRVALEWVRNSDATTSKAALFGQGVTGPPKGDISHPG